MTNLIVDLYNKYPDGLWDYYELSINPNLSFDIVKKYYMKMWDFDRISMNLGINWDIVNNYKDIIPFHYRYLTKNPNITIDIMKNYETEKWDYIYLSKNPNRVLEYNGYILHPEEYKNELDIYLNEIKNIENIKNVSYVYLEYYDHINSPMLEYTLDDLRYYQHNMNKYKNEFNILDKIIKNPVITKNTIEELLNYEIHIDFILYTISSNELNYIFMYDTYRKRLVDKMLDKCKEELISNVCTPKRILNWNENVLLDKEHPLYGKTQQEIDDMLI